MSPFNRALGLIPKRAERQQSDRLRETFVDSGVAGALESIDHQVIYGRRGTGKTHALRYVESTMRARGDVAIYVDLRQIGSPDGLFAGDVISLTERTRRLLVDLLLTVHNELLTAAIADDALIDNRGFVNALDELDDAITSVDVVGDMAVTEEHEQTLARKTNVGGGAKVTPHLFELSGSASTSRDDGDRSLRREIATGQQRVRLNFGEVSAALRAVVRALTSQRVWLLLDEWNAVPREVQPMLAEFLARCVLPLDKVSAKIAAIEQESTFRTELDGSVIGIELGADVAADLNLDEFLVFEKNEQQSREFFHGLLFKHINASAPEDGSPNFRLRNDHDLIQVGFTDRRAFDELVRAAEGVPRDAINIAAKAAFRAKTARISIPDVRASARQWYQSDKEQAVRGRANAEALLRWIIDEVIRGRRARGFLVNQQWSDNDLLRALFEARVLHIVRRGYSAQDQPGERYDVWVIDYGAYVDLINTRNEPESLAPFLVSDGLPFGMADGSEVDVPAQDLRAIRRAILDLGQFNGSR